MSFYFEDQRSPEIGEFAKRNALIIIPVGMIEQHGPHLPVSTDNIIANGIARMIGENIADRIPMLVLPCVFTGYHGSNLMEWPGSARVMPETLYHFVYDICESLCQGGFKKIMFINAHGQNPAILELVCRRIADNYGVNPILTYAMGMIGKEGASIRTSSQGGAGGHACEVETSLVLALAPELVNMSLAPDSTCQYRTEFHSGDIFPEKSPTAKVYWSSFDLQKTKTGVLGNAQAGSAEKGKKFLECMLQNYISLIAEYYHFN